MAGTANEREFSQGQRDSMAGKKQAMPDGSFPINNRQDLLNAIKLVGRAKNPAAAKAHIKRRAKALGLTNLLPDDWKSASSSASESVGQFTGEDRVSAPSPVLGFYADEALTVKADADSGKPPKFAEVVIIAPGVTKSKPSRTYPATAIQQAVNEGLWNGARMFTDHNPKAPLERKTPELVGGIVKGTVRVAGPDEVDADGNSIAGAAVGKAKFFSPQFASFAQEAAGYIEVSSSHNFEGRRYRQAGQIHEEVDRFTSVNSVDWVPFAAAGGKVLGFASESQSEDGDMPNWDDLTADDIRAHRSDLIDEIVGAANESESEGDPDVNGDQGGAGKPPVITDGMSAAEIRELVQTEVRTASEAVEDRHKKITEAERKTRALVSTSGLPPRAQERVIARFDGSEEFVEATVNESIEDMKAVIAEVKPPTVRGLGSSVAGSANEGQTTTTPAAPAHSAVMRAFGIKPAAAAAGQEGAK